MAERQCVVVTEVVPEINSGLDSMALFRRGETFDKLQMVSLVVCKLLDDEKCKSLFIELKDILVQDPPLLSTPRGSTCTHYGSNGYGKAILSCPATTTICC